MANRFPLIVDNATQTIRELPSGDNIDLTGSDALFGDNDKAIFGAGSDLQIFHDGSNSYIDEVGTGSLFVRATNLNLQQADGAKSYLTAAAGGALTLRHDGSEKLATTSTGIDVTGTVTADGLTVDANSGNIELQWAAGSTHKVGSSYSTTYFTGMRVTESSRNTDIISLDASGIGNINLFTGSAETKRMSVDPSGDISFYEDTGTTPKFFWDASAESLGLGSASPDSGRKLHIEGGDTTVGITLKDTAGSQYGITNDNNVFTVRNDSLASDRLVIDSSGNVGIGTSSPTSGSSLNKLINIDVSSGQKSGISLSEGGVNFFDVFFDGSDNSANLYNGASGGIKFYGSGTEAMRIDASGNLLVGTTDSTIYNDSTGSGFVVSSAGQVQALVNSAEVAILNRRGTDGGILQLRKDGTTVGSIGNNGGNLYIQGSTATGKMGLEFGGSALYARDNGAATDGSNDLGDENYRWRDLYLSGSVKVGTGGRTTFTGGGFYDNAANGNDVGVMTGGNQVFLSDGNGTATDGTKDLGASNRRLKDIYATNALIQTSDRNEKQDIAELDEAERRVAIAAKGLLRKFRWKDAVAEKGDDARIHFGIIAQDLQAAFEAEGLDAGRYGMFIHSTWTDEETGEERSRMGVRYSELLAFIIAAI